MHSPPPAEMLAAWLAYVAPGEPISIPHALAVALSQASPPAVHGPPPDYGSAPGGDFCAADLMARYSKSRGWVRQRMGAGAFGPLYRIGKERIATAAGVLEYDRCQREGATRSPTKTGGVHPIGKSASKASGDGLSLVERRRGAGCVVG